MGFNWEAISDNIINISKILNDFLDTENTKKVEWTYIDENNEAKTLTINNIAYYIKQLEDTAVTPDELADELKNYYSKTEVDAIKNSIMKIIDANKNKITDRVNNLESKLDTEIAAREMLSDEVSNLEKRTVMTEAEYQALAEARRKIFAGSGVVEFGNTFSGLTDPYRFTLKDLWNHSWQGCCNFRNKTDPDEYAHYGETAKVLHWSRGEYSYIGGSINPVLNVNGNRIVIRGINQSKAFENCVKNVIEFPEAPTVKAIIKDSTSLPIDIKQGDFGILKDLDRELIQTPDEHVEEGCSVEKDDNGNYVVKTIDLTKNHAFYFRFNRKPLIKNVKYRFSFKIVDWEDDDTDFIFRPFIINKKFTPFGFNTSNLTKGETLEVEFTVEDNYNNNNMYFGVTEEDKSITVGDFKLYQVEEQPIVALRDIERETDIYQRPTAFEAREFVSRQDLVFLEVWDEDITEKDFVYPFGNVQYQGGNTDGLSDIDEGTFEGADTYSLFGVWQEPGALIGKGYKWSQLSEGNKIKLASNPDNNIRKKGDTWLQTRYRVRVVKGLGNDWFNIKPDLYGSSWDRFFGYPYIIRPLGNRKVKGDYSVYGDGQVLVDDYADHYDNFTLGLSKIKNPALWDNPTRYLGTFEQSNGGGIYALPLILVQRRNDGIYNKVFNPVGTAQAYDKDNDKLLEFGEYALDDSFVTSLEDCFDISKIAAKTVDDNVVPADDSSAKYRSGYIMSKLSGHGAGLYADEINERDVEDLRMRAEKKPYKEILNEYLQKTINAEIRGKEPRMRLIADYTASTQDLKEGLGYYLYIGDKETIKFNKNDFNFIIGISDWFNSLLNKDYKTVAVLYHPEVGIQAFRSFYCGDYYIGVDHYEDSSRLELFANKNNVRVMIFTDYKNNFIEDNTVTQTDIIGDLRKIKDRVSLTVTDTDETVVLKHNTYVLCNDATNNNGTVGHYYRYLGSDLSNIHTNSTDGDANSEDGHIDFSDTDKWLDLGDDGNIGGYPDAWLEKGIQGTPLIVGEKGESLLPINAEIYPNPSISPVIGFDDYNKGLYVKLTKKLKRLRRVSVRKKDGSWIDYALVSYNESLHAATGNGWKPELKNRVYVNLNDESISALGYNSLNEALDLIQIVIVYEAYANFLENTSSSKVLEINKQVQVSGDKLMDNTSTDVISNNLLNKIITNNYDLNVGLSLQTFGINKHGTMSPTYEPLLHTDIRIVTNINGTQSITSPMVKHILYLTEINKRTYLQFIFKELKYVDMLDSKNNPNVYFAIDTNDKVDNGGEIEYKLSELCPVDADNTDLFVWISSVNLGAGPEVYYKGTNEDGSDYQKIGNAVDFAVVKNGTNWLLRIPITRNSNIKSNPNYVKIKANNYEYVVIDKLAIVDTSVPSPNNYITGTWGDNNKFEIVDNVSTTTDLNGEKVLIGQKRVALPYFITD